MITNFGLFPLHHKLNFSSIAKVSYPSNTFPAQAYEGQVTLCTFLSPPTNALLESAEEEEI